MNPDPRPAAEEAARLWEWLLIVAGLLALAASAVGVSTVTSILFSLLRTVFLPGFGEQA